MCDQLTDYAKEINGARRLQRRRRAGAWIGMVVGTSIGAIGMGALIGLGSLGQTVGVLVVLAWFGWSILELREP